MRQSWRYIFLVIFGLYGIALPAHASSSIEITEIMYDPPGADSGHEWIEIANTGSAPADLSKWIFVVGGKNHKLKFLAGGSVLLPGAVAIIAENEQTFRSDYPSYSGMLIRSSFSLSNAGESLAFLSASSTLQTRATYNAEGAASGKGGSLHLSGNAFLAGVPTPGIYPDTTLPIRTATTGNASATVQAHASGKTPAAKISPASPPATAQAPSVQATTGQGAAALKSSSGSSLLWEALAGLAALIIMGSAGAMLAGRKGTPAESAGREKSEADEYEIL